jgi:hypothetical protein
MTALFRRGGLIGISNSRNSIRCLILVVCGNHRKEIDRIAGVSTPNLYPLTTQEFLIPFARLLGP